MRPSLVGTEGTDREKAAHQAVESPPCQAEHDRGLDGTEGSWPLNVPPSRSTPLLERLPPYDDGPLPVDVDTMALPPPPGSAPSAEGMLAEENTHSQVALRHELPIHEPGLGETAEHDLQEPLLAVSPQLTSIPENVEEEITVDVDSMLSTRSPTTPSPTPASSLLPEEDRTTEETMALGPPESATSSALPSSAQDQKVASSALDTQATASSASSLIPPSEHQEDGGNASSPASTNGEANSIFDDDGDYHSDTSSYTTSLLSDVKNYTYENGRRYHSYREGHYVLPNDDQEQDRQDLLHHVRNLVLNGALFRAPLGSNIQRVLDIGTGTGIWAIDFADGYPSAEVIGTDLSPIQPSWVPPNLRFLVDDAESPWLFSASRPFDFIHARDLGGAIADWPRLLRQAYVRLRPGGWIELQEFEVTLRSDDDTLRLAPTLCEFLGRLHEASEAFHRPMNIAEGHRQRLIEAGFADVRDEVYKVRLFPLL